MSAKLSVLIAALLVSLSLSSVFADVNKVGTYNIGLGAGFVTGYGLSYRQWFGKNGVQVTLGPYYSSDTTETNFTNSLGVVGLRMLIEARVVNLFAYYGANFWYSSDKQTTASNVYTNQSTTTITKRIYAVAGRGWTFISGNFLST